MLMRIANNEDKLLILEEIDEPIRLLSHDGDAVDIVMVNGGIQITRITDFTYMRVDGDVISIGDIGE